MRVWTEQQQIAISSPARRIICSAAAGSGKTAVMVERVIRMLQDGADPESFLVVTFTNAAAAEIIYTVVLFFRDMLSISVIITSIVIYLSYLLISQARSTIRLIFLLPVRLENIFPGRLLTI